MSSEAPRTRSRFPTMEPVIEAWTISILPSAMRNPAMMISPRVANRRVHDAADPRAGRQAQLLGRMAERVGKAQDGEGADAEGQRLVGAEQTERQGHRRAADRDAVGDGAQH